MMLSSCAVDRADAGLSPWLRTHPATSDTTTENQQAYSPRPPPNAAPGLDHGEDGDEGQRGRHHLVSPDGAHPFGRNVPIPVPPAHTKLNAPS